MYFIFIKMSGTPAQQKKQIMNAVSLLQKFAKKGMVGSAPTAMDAKRRKRTTGGKKTTKKAGGKRRKSSKK